jgi:hypothetical protein
MATAVTSKGRESTSQTVARAKKMLGSAYNPNTKKPSRSRMREISEQSFIDPKVKAAYDKSTIAADAIGKEERPDFPAFEPTTTVDPAAFNAGLTSENLAADGGMLSTVDQKIQAAEGEKDASFKSYFDRVMDTETPSGADIQRKLERETDIRDLRREEGEQSARINAIIAERDANILRVEGQGRGIPEPIIGGQQAKINKEAAIAALPLQAQLAATQGKIALAQDYINTWGKILMQDAQNEYNKNLTLANMSYEYASKKQQGIIDDLKAQKAQDFQITQNNIAYSRTLQASAINFGQGNLVSQIASIDPSSPTFESEIANMASQLREPVTGTPARRDTQVVDGQLVDMQTGEIIASISGGDGVGGVSPITGEAYTQSQSQAGTFAARMEGAMNVIEDPETKTYSAFIGGLLPDKFKGSGRKEFEQAENNFITAVLRRESGAAIAPEEYVTARSVYIPLPGDEAEVLAQKALARQIVFEGMKNESVGAYEQLTGSLPTTQTTEPTEGVTSSGIKYTIE